MRRGEGGEGQRQARPTNWLAETTRQKLKLIIIIVVQLLWSAHRAKHSFPEKPNAGEVPVWRRRPVPRIQRHRQTGATWVHSLVTGLWSIHLPLDYGPFTGLWSSHLSLDCGPFTCHWIVIHSLAIGLWSIHLALEYAWSVHLSLEYGPFICHWGMVHSLVIGVSK